MEPKIHTYTSKEPMLRVNAYIIETDEKVGHCGYDAYNER
jgi:hypothetical protein